MSSMDWRQALLRWRIQFRRGTTDAWESANPVLLLGEPGWDVDLLRMKIGDGETPWNDLLWASLDPTQLQEILDLLEDLPDLDDERMSTVIADVGSDFFGLLSDYVESVTADYIPLTQRGANNGVATLDSGGKLPTSQLPTSVMDFKGAWNASTNSPTLVDGTGDAGDQYRVSVAGTRNLGSGSIAFDIGDAVIYSGTVWQKYDNTESVSSVAGKTGVVVLARADVGLNKAGMDAAMDEVLVDPTTAFATDLSASMDYAGATLPPHKLAVEGTEPGAVVCWTGDDGYSLHVPYFALMNARGIKGTLFLTKNWVNKAGTEVTWNDTYITQTQVQAIATAGHEIGTHGVNHENMPSYRDANGVAAMATLFDTVANYVESTYVDSAGNPLKVLTGAYPYGRSDRQIREIAGRRHRFHRGTKGVTATEAWNPFDVPGIDVQALTEAQIKAYIDTAVAESAIVVFLIHGEPPGSTRDALMTKLGNCMDYATSLGVPQKSFAAAMDERTARRSPGHMVDTSGNAFFRRLRTQRMTLSRSDTKADSAWFDMDLISNAAYADGNNGQPFEFRSAGLRVVGSSFRVGRRSIYSGNTVNGSPAVTIALLDTVDDGIKGLGISSASGSIPAGSKVGSYDATHLYLVAADGVTVVNATATVTNDVITVAWPAAPTSRFFGGTEFHGGNPKVYGTAGSKGYDIYDLATNTRTLTLNDGKLSATSSFRVESTGGRVELLGSRVFCLDPSGVRTISFGPALPSDASIDNGETVVYADPATGALLFKGKASGGTVFGPFTLARVAPRLFSTADTATLTVDASSYDAAKVTALAQTMTIAAPTGTPAAMQTLVIRIKDNGTARGLTWASGASAFRAVGVTLPTSTTVSKTLYVGAKWNADDSRWDVIAVAQES